MLALYSWGANSHGQLGLGYESEMCTTPQQIQKYSSLELDTIDKIRGGGGHLLVLNKAGNLFAVGANQKGQLGLNTTENVHTLTPVPELKAQIVDIVCGWDSSAAIDKNGNLFVFGSNAFNQLGFSSKRTPYIAAPVILTLPNNEKAKNVSFGLRFMCVLCENNTIYVFGRWKFGTDFKSIEHNDINIYQLSLGGDFNIDHFTSGANHIIFSCHSNTSATISAFGDNKFGQSENKVIKHERIRSLRSGWTHNGILTENGNVFLYGRNTYGQLATENAEKSNELIRLSGINEKIEEFHLGSEHALVITGDRRVWTWGWNEHGNCGNGNDLNVHKPFCVPLPGKSVLSAAGAGFCYALVNLTTNVNS